MGPQKHVIVRSVESGEIKKSLNSAKKHALVKKKKLYQIEALMRKVMMR